MNWKDKLQFTAYLCSNKITQYIIPKSLDIFYDIWYYDKNAAMGIVTRYKSFRESLVGVKGQLLFCEYAPEQKL